MLDSWCCKTWQELSYPLEREEAVGYKHHSQELEQTVLFCHKHAARSDPEMILSRAELQPYQALTAALKGKKPPKSDQSEQGTDKCLNHSIH